MTKYVNVPSKIGIGLLGLIYPLGSDFEIEGHYGTHHLMEHLMCKSFDHILPKLKRLGIQHNAYTSNNRIVFHFEGLDEKLELIAQEVHDLITFGKHTWAEEEFNNEKKTVLQEYEDRFNDQISGTLSNIIRKYYNCFEPIGLRTDIENFSYEDSLKFRKRFNRPTIICQVGKSSIGGENKNNPKSKIRKPLFGAYDVPQEVVPKEGKTVVGLLSKSVAPKNEINKLNFIINCLTSGIESPLYQEIREKRGLSYASFGWVNEFFQSGVIAFMAVTSNKNTKKLIKVYEDFFSGDLLRHIPQDRFNDCYDECMINKMMCERLPHDGVKATVLQDSPFEGLDEFNYEEALKLLNKYFKFDCFQEIKY
jgi:predicted Zn-dependent peptidase